MPEPRPISIDLIAGDRSLAYRDPAWPGAPALRASLARCGVLRPLQLQETEEGLRVVAGFRRLAVARQLGLAQLPARVATAAAPTWPLFRSAVEEHAGEPVSLRERLGALAVAERLGLSAAEVCSELLPALGLPAEPRLLDDLRRCQALAPALLQLLTGKTFSLRRCLPFTRFSLVEGELLAGLAGSAGLGGRQIEELASMLLELAAREGVAPEPLLRELAARSAAERLPWLERRRYPETARRRAVLQANADALLAAGLQLRFDPGLAREELELAFPVASVDELPRLLEVLGAAATRLALQRALEALR